jgi:hypothetical protein
MYCKNKKLPPDKNKRETVKDEMSRVKDQVSKDETPQDELGRNLS